MEHTSTFHVSIFVKLKRLPSSKQQFCAGDESGLTSCGGSDPTSLSGQYGPTICCGGSNPSSWCSEFCPTSWCGGCGVPLDMTHPRAHRCNGVVHNLLPRLCGRRLQGKRCDRQCADSQSEQCVQISCLSQCSVSEPETNTRGSSETTFNLWTTNIVFGTV